MPRHVALILIFVGLFVTANGQGDFVSDSTLSYNQQWAVAKFEAFAGDQNLNVQKSSVVSQFQKAVKSICTLNCFGVVPVEGLELKGKRLNSERVELSFFTFSEINNEGFIIQRRFNEGNGPFENVGFLKGTGNSLQGAKYGFIDNNTYNGYSFYRIKQIDLDGNFTFSEIVRVDGYHRSIALRVVPNPAISGKIVLQCEGFTTLTNNNIIITDAKGSTVFNRASVNIYNHSLDLNVHLPAGIYYVRMYNAEENAGCTFVVK